MNMKLLKSGESVKLTVLNGAVAVISIDCAGKDVNVLSTPLMTELDAVVTEVSRMSNLRGLVLTSGKATNFIAGANLDEIVEIQNKPSTVAFEATELGKAIFAKIKALPLRKVAAVHGTARGGGVEILLPFDFRICSDDAKTTFGLPEVGLGFIPGWGGTVLLPKLVGAQTALDMILQPLKSWDAKKAWKTGLIDEITSRDKLLERAVAIASGASPKRARKPLKAKLMRSGLERKTLAAVALTLVGLLVGGVVGLPFGWLFGGAWAGAKIGGLVLGLLGLAAGMAVPFGRNALHKGAKGMVMKETKGNYPAPLAALDVVVKSLTMPTDKALKLESATFAKLCVGEVSKSLTQFYLSTQDAKKVPAGVRPAVEIKTVGVLGAGVMGGGIAQAAAYSGFKVVVREPFAGSMAKGKAAIKALFDGLVEKGKLSREEGDRLFGNITFTADYADMADCDIVIEAIIEDMKAKQDALAELEKVIGKPWIFATNTSSLSLDEMVSRAARPDLSGGLHFFNPVHKMMLVEVVRGDKSSPETLAALRLFAGKLGKTVVQTADAPGFAVNRILAPYLFEAIRLFEQGVPGEDIEKAMTRLGMPMGPLALLDEVGLDIAGHVIHVMHKALGDRLAPPALLSWIEAENARIRKANELARKEGRAEEPALLGKKSGKGIFLYDSAGKPQGFNPDVLKQITAAKSPRKLDDIQDRLALVMVNEAALCMAEGIVDTPAELDLAMVLGTGFLPYRGGVLRYADWLGARAVVDKLDLLAAVCGPNYKPAALLREMAVSGRGFYKRASA